MYEWNAEYYSISCFTIKIVYIYVCEQMWVSIRIRTVTYNYNLVEVLSVRHSTFDISWLTEGRARLTMGRPCGPQATYAGPWPCQTGPGPHNLWPDPWPLGGWPGPALGPRGPGLTRGQCSGSLSQGCSPVCAQGLNSIAFISLITDSGPNQ